MGALVVQAAGQAPVMFSAAFTVGRPGADADMEIDDEYLSTRHARFSAVDGTWVVEDMGSTNGTWVNGIKYYTPVPLARGDKVQVGHTFLTVVPIAG
jgi:pSer/pThr/pTyr-binding forkhead associated (FHA) protein